MRGEWITGDHGEPVFVKAKNKKAEKSIQDAIIKYALLKKYIVIRFNSGVTRTNTGAYFTSYVIKNNGLSSGMSDLMLIKGEKVILLEVKKKGGRVAISQRKFKSLCENYGFTNYHIVDSLEQAKTILE